MDALCCLALDILGLRWKSYDMLIISRQNGALKATEHTASMTEWPTEATTEDILPNQRPVLIQSSHRGNQLRCQILNSIPENWFWACIVERLYPFSIRRWKWSRVSRGIWVGKGRRWPTFFAQSPAQTILVLEEDDDDDDACRPLDRDCVEFMYNHGQVTWLLHAMIFLIFALKCHSCAFPPSVSLFFFPHPSLPPSLQPILPVLSPFLSPLLSPTIPPFVSFLSTSFFFSVSVSWCHSLSSCTCLLQCYTHLMMMFRGKCIVVVVCSCCMFAHLSNALSRINRCWQLQVVQRISVADKTWGR